MIGHIIPGLLCFFTTTLVALLLGGQETAKKAPVPDAKAQAAATASSKTPTASELSTAKSSEQRIALAEKFLQLAEVDEKNPSAQFVLLQHVIDLSTQGRNCQLAMQAIDDLDRSFEIDLFGIKAELIRKCGSCRSHQRATPIDRRGRVRSVYAGYREGQFFRGEAI